jgi:hypothetical protein
MAGFDFARDPLGSLKPKMLPEEIMKADIAAKPQVMAQHKQLLDSRYDLTLQAQYRRQSGLPHGFNRPAPDASPSAVRQTFSRETRTSMSFSPGPRWTLNTVTFCPFTTAFVADLRV